jgi:hypothetical protein
VEGFICSDYIDVGGYASLAPFGCIVKVQGVIDGQGIAGMYVCMDVSCVCMYAYVYVKDHIVIDGQGAVGVKTAVFS